MRLLHRAIELFADYHQFYLWDAGTNPQAPTDYSEEDVERRIKTGPHVVVIQPERNATVPIEVEVHDVEPPSDPDTWNHVAEASLHLPTGRLQVHECTGGPVADFIVVPGWYRVRSFHGGLATVNASALEGQDYYRIILWPAPQKELQVVKGWVPLAFCGVAPMFFPPPFTCTGRSRGLSVPRAFLADFVHFARKMPLVAVSRRMDLGSVVAARKAVSPSPNWVLLFAKAFARVAADRPALRQAFMTFPWTHLYECDQSVAAIAVEREYAGEAMVLFALFKDPHLTPLAELAARLHDFKTQPVESVEPLHRLIRITKLPKLARRALWVHALYQSGRIKAQNFGTFGVSSVAGAGATTVGMASLLTNTLSLGPFDEAGRLDVRLDFDHRVYDGVPAANALAAVERVLRTEIVAELQALAPPSRTE